MSKSAELDEWLSKHEEKASRLGDAGSLSINDLEAAIVPANALSRQALMAAAEDMAIEDTLYSLERGLQNGIVEPEAYLKQERFSWALILLLPPASSCYFAVADDADDEKDHFVSEKVDDGDEE